MNEPSSAARVSVRLSRLIESSAATGFASALLAELAGRIRVRHLCQGNEQATCKPPIVKTLAQPVAHVPANISGTVGSDHPRASPIESAR